MGGTTWTPMTRFEPKEFLFGDGTIVREPALEMSGSGRKVRVVGQTESVFMQDLDSLIARAAESVAATKGTHVWLQTTGGVPQQISTKLGGTNLAATKAKLHLVHDPTNKNGFTTLWWRFKDSNTPFEVVLLVTLVSDHRTTAINGQRLNVQAVIPTRSYYGDAAGSDVVTVTDDVFSTLVAGLTHRDTNLPYKWGEFIRDTRPNWPAEHLGIHNKPHARVAVQDLLKVVRDFEDLSEIEVPFLGNPEEPSYITLELYGTNCNAELLSDLTEYLDGAPTIERAAELYQEMLATLRSVGISVQDKAANDFLATLLAGEKAALNMQVFSLAEEGGAIDHNHNLAIHLPTGAFIVECSHHATVDQNQVAEKWEEALMLASLTGEEDTLLAYARQYAQENNKRRTGQILKERKS